MTIEQTEARVEDRRKYDIGAILTVLLALLSLAFYAGISWYSGQDGHDANERQWTELKQTKADAIMALSIAEANRGDLSRVTKELQQFTLDSLRKETQLSSALAELSAVMKGSLERLKEAKEDRIRSQDFMDKITRDISEVRVSIAEINSGG